MDGTGVPIDQAIIFPIPILADPAKTPLPLGDTASLGAEIALDLASPEGGKIGGKLCLDEALPRCLSLGCF